ncbi:glutamate 5-kinase [Rathayibacter sp. PhB185]|nr:glutamate 5-kinase [Rathayibacter sp. PhB186]ROS53217.1 glutamate 5-kinase [Rathayibacter sp. PhB185]TCL83733.1 glutamate 5-kinase [Rathayibacter sp. PhB192]TCM29326.1 glutamate 5-kinase [Rathayibacter sp. PhB179]
MGAMSDALPEAAAENPSSLPARRRTLVVKMGSSSVTKQSGPDPVLLASALESAFGARALGWDVVLVSSGAVSSGRALFARSQDAPISPRLAAAVGQTVLMGFYRSVAELSGSLVAQILIGESDLASPRQMAHVAEAIRHALDAGVVPIVNGNDTIDSAGSDNDGVAGGLAMLLGADLLLLLTDVPGVFAGSIAEGVHLEELGITELRGIGVQKGGTGRGGIRSKLKAAELAAHNGVSTRIAGARTPEVILGAIDGPGPGTLVRAVHAHPAVEQRWISGVATSRGRVEINLEAERSIASGSSLFASGIKRVSGDFVGGDVIEVRALSGELLARGVSRVSSRLLTLVRALRVDEIARVFVAVLAHAADADPAAITSEGDRPQLTRALEYARALSFEHGRAVAMEIVSLFPAESIAALVGQGAAVEELVERYTRLVRTLAIVGNEQLAVFRD